MKTGCSEPTKERLAAHLEAVSLLIEMLRANADELGRCVTVWRAGGRVDRSDLTRASYLHSLVRDAKSPPLLPSALLLEWLLAHAASGEAFTFSEGLHGRLSEGYVQTAAEYLPQIEQRIPVMDGAVAKLAGYSEQRLLAAHQADKKRGWFSP